MAQDDLGTLREIATRVKVAMLTTRDTQGMMRSRPLHTLEADEQGRLWFFVSASSPKIDEMQREHGEVCLAYADTGKQDYASISGRGEILRDRERMQALWSPWVKVWFPQGIDDPDLALLCVRIEKAEYWESPGGKVQQLYGLAKARMTGNKDAIGENRKLRVG
ncbi:MAG TPA: pyridoxamine 5'-phosphate oxidase family protein [Burkholderiales bacterium]|nr:pyridoxamine 5'-phosphate oxidase family protein [Burkholderiales bacterium]